MRQVDLGQYIAAGTAIVTLQQLDPMFVDFYLPQQALGEIAVGQKVEVTADAYPGRTFDGDGVVAELQGRSHQPDAAGAGEHSQPRRGAAAGDVS